MTSVSWLPEALQNVGFVRSFSSPLSFVLHKLERYISAFVSSLLLLEK